MVLIQSVGGIRTKTRLPWLRRNSACGCFSPCPRAPARLSSPPALWISELPPSHEWLPCNQSLLFLSLPLSLCISSIRPVCLVEPSTDRNFLICTIPNLQTDPPPIHLHLLSCLTTEDISFLLLTASLSTILWAPFPLTFSKALLH